MKVNLMDGWLGFRCLFADVVVVMMFMSSMKLWNEFVGILAHLQVILGIPVGIVDDDGVGSRQIYAQTTCSRAQQEYEPVRIGFAESVDGLLPQTASDSAVDPLV